MIYYLLACASLYVFTPWRLINVHFQFRRSSTIFRVIYTASTQASFITAVLMAAERFYAIYWPLKHRTISMRAWLVILTAWTLAFLLTVFLLHFTNSQPLAQNVFICLYGLFLVVTICSLNISVWRKVSARNCSPLSPKQSILIPKPAFNESLVICVCFDFELLNPCYSSGYQFYKHFWIPHLY